MQIRNINLYDPEIESIPHYNWHRAQRYIILDAGLGSSTGDILKRINNINTYILNDRKEDAMQEVQNMTLGVFSALEGIDYSSMILSCLVRDINGVKYEIATDKDVAKVCEAVKATGITTLELQSYIDDLKKKLILQ
jgi:hypothetical protein